MYVPRRSRHRQVGNGGMDIKSVLIVGNPVTVLISFVLGWTRYQFHSQDHNQPIRLYPQHVPSLLDKAVLVTVQPIVLVLITIPERSDTVLPFLITTEKIHELELLLSDTLL